MGEAMNRTALASLVAAALMSVGAAQANGRAEVRYIAPETFADAGFGAVERERTQRVLTAHFDRLAKRLPDGQVLRVDITDVDLAGEIDSFVFHPVRVMGQLPDAPRLGLKFELRQGGQLLAQGEERLTDLAYLDRRISRRQDGPLLYEGRLLDQWFGQRFAPQLATVR
jgi:hypothetical protein